MRQICAFILIISFLALSQANFTSFNDTRGHHNNTQNISIKDLFKFNDLTHSDKNFSQNESFDRNQNITFPLRDGSYNNTFRSKQRDIIDRIAKRFNSTQNEQNSNEDASPPLLHKADRNENYEGYYDENGEYINNPNSNEEKEDKHLIFALVSGFKIGLLLGLIIIVVKWCKNRRDRNKMNLALSQQVSSAAQYELAQNSSIIHQNQILNLYQNQILQPNFSNYIQNQQEAVFSPSIISANQIAQNGTQYLIPHNQS